MVDIKSLKREVTRKLKKNKLKEPGNQSREYGNKKGKTGLHKYTQMKTVNDG